MPWGLLLDAVGPAPRPRELMEIRAVSLLLVDELGRLADQAGEMLRAAGYEPEVRVVPKLEIGMLG
jgi:hypothetical protein